MSKNYFPFYFIAILSLGGILGVMLRMSSPLVTSFAADPPPAESFLTGAALFWPLSLIISIVLMKKNGSLHTSWKRTIINVAIVLCTMVVVPLGAAPPELIFVLNPDIDTQYTAGYSEKNFCRIVSGMTEKDVAALLGHPFYITKAYFPDKYDAIWSYTGDGGCPWYDFAWLSKQVHLKRGVVVETVTN